MLIIVKDGDIEQRLQFPLYFKTARSRDIFQVDAAKHRRNIFDRLNNFFRVLRRQHYRKSINISKFFEQHAFPLHHGQRPFRTDVAETQDG